MEIAYQQAVIDLTQVPYFVEPLSLEEGSSGERLTGVSDPANVLVIPDYTVDRRPVAGATLSLGGSLGPAALYDVAAHPVRARVHRIQWARIVAIALVCGAGMVIATLVVTFRH
ncbi:MAG: hypothetical protein ACTHK4_00240 [Mycobacteriales bacterium]